MLFTLLLQRSQPGRLPDTSLPTIQNSVSVVDFSWDPFDTHRLAVGKQSRLTRVFFLFCFFASLLSDLMGDISISTQQAGDDAKIRVWRVPEGGLKEMMTEPEIILQGRCEPPPLVSGFISYIAR